MGYDRQDRPAVIAVKFIAAQMFIASSLFAAWWFLDTIVIGLP